MLSSRWVLLLCAGGTLISVHLRSVFPCEQALLDSCIASFIVTGLLTLNTRYYERVEGLKNLHISLREVYYDLDLLRRYIMVAELVMFSVIWDYEFAIQNVRIRNVAKNESEDAAFSALLDELAKCEDSFNRLESTLNQIGCFISELEKHVFQVNLYKYAGRRTLRVGVSAYVDKLNTMLADLCKRLDNCSNVCLGFGPLSVLYNQHDAKLRCLDLMDKHIEDLKVFKKESLPIVSDLEAQTRELLGVIEAKIGRYISSMFGNYSRRVADVSASSRVGQYIKDLRPRA